ncbi:hypothetical protein ACIGNX_34050 [Actinosynnema sp. NPDC053489]|uniref:hypothetical protein n=1 Tax=Actinosynnema sp. NPDC053489 TaxID=3363916 RepID=UPI0037C70B7A
MTENVDEAAERLSRRWLELPDGVEGAVALHEETLDLARRHPLAESVAESLEIAAQVYARLGALHAATTMAARAVEVRRDACLDAVTAERLGSHVFALDLLAGVFRARGLEDAVTGCLVQLVEMHFRCENNAGVAWAVRELGAQALLAGDADNAVAKLARAEELYAGYGDDESLAEERGECRVLLGRALLARGDRESALPWFERAVRDFTAAGADALAREAEALRAAVSASAEPPAPVLLKIGDFGAADW